MKETIKVSVATTVYPGSRDAPTRHTFGSSFEPTELHGRWMTRHLPGKTAAEYAAAWREFVRDEQTIRMAWGNVVSYQGVIEELELAYESPDEIAWRMVVLIDLHEQQIELGGKEPPIAVPEKLDELQAFINKYSFDLYDLPDMQSDLFEQLDFMFGSLKSLTGLIADVGNIFDNLERMTFSTIQSARGVLANVNSGITQIRNTIVNGQIDSVMAVRRAESDIKWWLYEFSFDADSLNAFAILAELDRALELQLQSDVGKFVTAIQGDTWERLATRAGIGPDGAATIREMNGARFGDKPVPGNSYMAP
ncbi:MAG: hypothetical protein KF795_00615 [Labilithrix sp.]|nr:hypothetical protein [Labilithrix sp.]